MPVKQLFLFLIAIFTIFIVSEQATAMEQDYQLDKCVVVTHCVRENWKVSNFKKTFDNVETIIRNTPRTKIVENENYYIHAEAKTKWRRYTDDLLIKGFPEKSLIQVRSESRVGVGDNGVNQKRVDELAYRLMTNQLDK